MMTPLAFLLAAIVMGLTVASYAELCTRFPVAAGEAAYVRAAFGSRWISTLTGLVMIGTGVIASATVAIGSAGYIAQFVNLPRPLIIAGVIIAIAIIVAWGVLESVVIASIFTIIEVGGLLLIMAAAWRADLAIAPALTAWPAPVFSQWSGVLLASLLAFFAFTGFEDLTNMIEEAHAPERNVPLAMAVTLVVTTTLYVIIAAIAVTALSPQELAGSSAPLSLVFSKVAGISATAISLIAIVSTLNTIIAQMTMSIRVVYGMAKQGDLPQRLARVHERTATPVFSTAIITSLSLAFALIVPFERLAEWTSLATLVVFALVNLALIKIRTTQVRAGRAVVHVPLVIPILGLIGCAMMIASSML
jgi:basic amino acid/polyamine antiporter, APA family